MEHSTQLLIVTSFRHIAGVSSRRKCSREEGCDCFGSRRMKMLARKVEREERRSWAMDSVIGSGITFSSIFCRLLDTEEVAYQTTMKHVTVSGAAIATI